MKEPGPYEYDLKHEIGSFKPRAFFPKKGLMFNEIITDPKLTPSPQKYRINRFSYGQTRFKFGIRFAKSRRRKVGN